jgi:hypothetical protein
VRIPLEIGPRDRGSRTVEARLARGRRVAGRVVDFEGHPMGGVSVAVVGVGVNPLRSTMVLSNADGSFVLDSLPPAGGEIGVLNRMGSLSGRPVSADLTDLVVVASEGTR